jgi:deoxyribonuclease-1
VVVSGQVVGNRNSHVFHAPNCPSVAKMKATNRVAFRTAAEAEAAGYRKGKDRPK